MRICGRDFTQAEIDWINTKVKTYPDLGRFHLSRIFCRHAGWLKPDGGLKDMSCRVAMLHLEKKGLIRLPPPKRKNGPVKKVKLTSKGAAQPEICLDVSQSLVDIKPVTQKDAPLWNELIERYHYLGYRRTGGAQMRFFVHADKHLVALLGFSAAAWRVEPRDSFIGWTDEQRVKNLHLIADNSRFLILPWVKARNLASKILATAARQVPILWQKRYHYTPLVLETFVQNIRFSGTCYKAANWIAVGQTRGRGKWDRYGQSSKPVKTVWLYPLDTRFKEHLCR